MRRRVLAVLLTVALAAGNLMGCSGNHTAPEKETGSTEKAVTQAVKDDETE